MTPEQARTWARAQVAKDNLARLAQLVAPVELMPLKGIELVFRYGVPAIERPMLDFDVLAPSGSFGGVMAAMEANGYRTIAPNYSARVLMAREGFIPVDVHRMPLPPMMGRLSAKRLFSRAERGSDVYGVPIAHARPPDFFVHLAANALKDRLPEARAASMLRDLVAVAAHTDPAAVAAASRDASLALSVWIVLTWMARTLPDFPLGEFRSALAPSRVDRWRAEGSLAAVSRWRTTHLEIAYALARSNTDEIWRGGLSAGLSFARAARDRLRHATSPERHEHAARS